MDTPTLQGGGGHNHGLGGHGGHGNHDYFLAVFSLTGTSEPFLCKQLPKQTYMLLVSMEEHVASEYECTVDDCHQVSSWEAKSIGKAIFPAPVARVHSGKFKSPI